MGTVSQYCSLAMLFILIKIQVSGLENIINKFEYIRNYFSIKDDNEFIFVGVVVFLLFFFYIGYAYLSFLSKKSSTAIITLHKNKIILKAQKKHYWQKNDFKLLASNFFDLYRRFFQAIAPIPIIIFGLLFISFFNIHIPILILLILVLTLTVYNFLKTYISRKDKNQTNEYLSNKRKLLAQVISIFLFLIILAIIFTNNYSIEITVALIIIGRILLGNFINFLHFIFEILSKLYVFDEIKKRI
jgi:hypothetical protein